jgi:hypothetical protein
MFHIGEARNKNVGHDDWLGQRDGRHLHGFPPKSFRLTGKLSNWLIARSRECEQPLTHLSSHGYRSVNCGVAG